jgi:hypothetical protein
VNDPSLVDPRTRTAVSWRGTSVSSRRTVRRTRRDVPTPPQLLMPFVRAVAN